jgi:hypothetical protein
MNGKHAFIISLAVGVAVVAGTIAATKTIQLGKAKPAAVQPASASATIAARTKQLDRAEITLHKALKRKPPKLPPLPATVPAGNTSTFLAAAAPQAQAQAQRVVYVRPAPIVKTIHRTGGHESEHESEHGGGGGGFDD